MNYFVSIISLSTLFFLACNDDDGDKSQIADPCLIDSTFERRPKYPIIKFPVANPNNPDEFAFIEETSFYLGDDKSIIILNFRAFPFAEKAKGYAIRFNLLTQPKAGLAQKDFHCCH